MNKKLAAIGLAAGLVAGAGAGFILEMSGSAGASNSAISAAVAATDHTARLQEVLQPLVDDGTLSQDQVDEVIAALEAARPEGRPGGPGGHGGRGPKLEVIATTIGITTDEVRTGLQDGQTIAEIATANGKTAQDVIDAILAEMKAHLDEEVAAGTHTQAEADAKLAEATTRVTEFVNNTPAPGEGRGPGMGGPRGGPGHMPADDAADTTTG